VVRIGDICWPGGIRSVKSATFQNAKSKDDDEDIPGPVSPNPRKDGDGDMCDKTRDSINYVHTVGYKGFVGAGIQGVT
jgi:hypothetical protein